MSEERPDAGNPPPSQEPRPAGAPVQTWLQWPGMPVYGAVKGAPPPELDRPWDFQPQQTPMAPPAMPVAPYPIAQTPAPMDRMDGMDKAEQSTHNPQPSTHNPPPSSFILHPSSFPPPPSPLGPAKTPEERAAELGITLPGESKKNDPAP